ncbi:MAG: hypothetical protein DI556_13490 [Rhodovulum sulfidophilum]|uniref:Phytase-like domain-containing protein n=1 Tax=Rhodovulum sulfidophilum TaxID=35806 RepID=A0A2W5Q245_RHOSU|nr:MAG: hypothetical protein DI556_13490 [Rhodovulum sulfidophilum]
MGKVAAIVQVATCAAIFAHAEIATAMEFRVVRNANEDRWIAAEGEIDPTTPASFLAFMDAAGALTGALVHLDSEGGDLAAAIRLGDLFRAYRLGTVVSASPGAEQPDGIRLVDPDSSGEAGRCASACVLAYSGGERRFASKDTDPRWISGRSTGRLEVHEFGFDTGLGVVRDRAPAGGDGADAGAGMAAVPREREVFDYLSRHGVSAELLQIAMLVPGGASLPLTEAQLTRLALDSGQPRSIEMRGYENGVGIVEVALTRPSGDYLLELYCRGGHIEILASVDWKLGLAADEFEGLGIFAATALAGHGAARLSKVEHAPDGEHLSSKVSLVLEGPMADLAGERIFRFEDPTGPEAAAVARDMSFAFPEGNTLPRLLPRTCL